MSLIAKVSRIAVATLLAGALFAVAPAGAYASEGLHPAPIIESAGGLVSIDARETEFSELLLALSEKTKTKIVIDKGISGKITVKLSAATIEEALQTICKNSAVEYEYCHDTQSWRVLRRFAFSGSDANRPKAIAEGRPTGKNDGNVAAPKQPVKIATAGDIAAPAGVTTTPTSAAAGSDQEKRPAYKKGELLVKFRQEATPEEIAALHARLGSAVIRTIPRIRVQRIRLKAGLDENDVLLEYRKFAIVEHVELHALRYPQVIPNDPGFASQWGMKKISAEALWNVATGNREIIVAVIDSGVDYTHPDLQGSIWINTVEQNGNPGVDDDPIGNVNDPDHIPYPDDIYGWDFAGATGAGDNDPIDSYGHGSHVAGIIGAVGNNGIGVTGVNWKIRIMPLKVMEDSDNSFPEAAIIEAIDYAIANGAAVVNCSFGGPLYSQNEYDAYDRLRTAGIIAAAAAGNANPPSTYTGFDMDGPANVKIYPACYDLDNIISVANSNSSDALATSSNYGKVTVDVAAPGESIYSTVPLSGTTASVKTLDASPALEFPALSLEYAALTTAAGITGTLYDCGMGYSDYYCGTEYTDQIPDAVSGNIALIKRGNCDGQDFYFRQKVQNAMSKGAAGVIIYNNLEDDPDDDDNFDTDGGTLGYPGNWIPAISISKTAGEALLALPLLSTGAQGVVLINKTTVNPYGYNSGTSMATPHVAGLAGLLAGICPACGYADIRAAIINQSDKIPALADKIASGGRINAFTALVSLLSPPGDFSGNGAVGMEDVIIALKIMASIEAPLACPLSRCTNLDIGGDGRATAAEILYILQKIAGIR